jgi:integrase
MAKTLTATAIERLQPGETRREVPDALLPGLYLVVQPSGVRSWAVRYRLHGKSHKFTIGPYPAFDLVAAREAAREALQLVARGTDPGKARDDRRRADAAEDTFEKVARQWIEKVQRPKKRTWDEAARLIGFRPDPDGKLVTIKGSPVDRLGDRKLSEIRRRDLLPVLEDIADRAPYVANRTQAYLSSMFAWAQSRDLIEANPVTGIEMQPEDSRDRVLTDDEIRRVWQAAGEVPGHIFGPLTKLLILTGARREEIGGLRWSEIEADRIELAGDRTKNGKPHIIPLSQPALDITQGLRKGSPFVFTLTGKAPVTGYSRVKDKLDDLSGVTGWRLHDLRRTLATNLRRKTPSVGQVGPVRN